MVSTNDIQRPLPFTTHRTKTAGNLRTAYSGPLSFWVTEDSLVRTLLDVGFKHISKVYVPRGYKCPENRREECRIIVVAKKEF